MQFGAMQMLCFALAASSAIGARLQGARLQHSQKMNPEAVAHTLVQVEDKWLHQAMAVAACNASEASYNECTQDTMGEFVKSCKTVISAVVEGSSGDKDNVKDYLNDVCGQGEMQGWKQDLCGNLSVALVSAMTEDSYVNREELNFEQICSNFMTHGFMKKAVDDEKAREEQERVHAEEEAKEAAKRAEEEAKAEAARKKAEEAQAKADAAKQAAEDAARKRQEAQEQAAEAKRKEEEAAAAEAKKHDAEIAANATVAEAKEARSRAANASASAGNVSISTTTGVPAANASEAPASANTSADAPSASYSNATAAAPANASQLAEKPAAKLLASKMKLIAHGLQNATKAIASSKNVTKLISISKSQKAIVAKANTTKANITKHQ